MAALLVVFGLGVEVGGRRALDLEAAARAVEADGFVLLELVLAAHLVDEDGVLLLQFFDGVEWERALEVFADALALVDDAEDAFGERAEERVVEGAAFAVEADRAHIDGALFVGELVAGGELLPDEAEELLVDALVGELELALDERLELAREDVEAGLVDALLALEVALADVLVRVEFRVQLHPVDALDAARPALAAQLGVVRVLRQHLEVVLRHGRHRPGRVQQLHFLRFEQPARPHDLGAREFRQTWARGGGRLFLQIKRGCPALAPARRGASALPPRRLPGHTRRPPIPR